MLMVNETNKEFRENCSFHPTYLDRAIRYDYCVHPETEEQKEIGELIRCHISRCPRLA